ncbi:MULTISPECIES: peptidase inhibitor family I36 protein [unclassified Streptomyces]|uniref:peptidase inhibitor family I36 protein n=1 Tax=unclassified Streptomyces TaxID=2593676 RepID=UPI0036E1AEED
MALRKAAASAAASLAFLIGLSGTASATTTAPAADNSGASIIGVTGHPSANNGGKDCAYGNLCLYTGPNQTGTRFDLYNCSTYSLNSWNGWGSWVNRQTPGQQAWFMDVNHTVVSTAPGSNGPDDYWLVLYYDYAPIWYVKNC